MNTASGALSIGAPHSAARYNSEATHAMGNAYQLLLLTEEGRVLFSRFAGSIGCDFSRMTNEDASDVMEREGKALFSFLSGVSFTFAKL